MIREPQSVADEATVGETRFASLAAQAPAMPWNGPLSRRRVYRRCRVPLDGVKQIRAATGVTVNDVVLAACSDALGRYLTTWARSWLPISCFGPWCRRRSGPITSTRSSAIGWR